ncbi:MAG: bifunctional riboflavin kinase/FAD synthetase [Candidatus Hydrogenedentes bacterium]|nr:bifunctional riboflavin kinase/FAD synthetase [Candidatus Hydrogenedentota bacterium]
MNTVANVLDSAPPPSPTALTIGSFDGVHLGHRRLLDALVEGASQRGLLPAAMTLDPHPRQFFAPHNAPNILTSNGQKARLLAAAGVQTHFVLPFDAQVARMEPECFVRDIVLGRCNARLLVVGHDFRFGRAAAGTHDYLQENADRFGLEVTQVEALVLGGQLVCSTFIRERILQGEVDALRAYLGRDYAIEGRVVSGRGMGAQIGYPTANIAPHNSAIPAHGVYAAETLVDGTAWPSAVNIGIAPTIRSEEVLIESHLLGYAGDLEGKTVEVVFHRRLRPEKKFPSLDALTAAIAADVEAVRAHFQGVNPAR